MIPSLVTFLVFLGLYSATLAPDVLPADSGEFQWVAATLGVAHPPGYPLYTMLGWLFAHLPLGPTPAWRVNLFSAATAAATVALVFRTAHRLTDSLGGGLAAALTLGSATTFWATATKASIRPLTAFFTALCLYTLTQHVTGDTPYTSRPASHPPFDDRYLTLFALALSLGLTHHASLGFLTVILIAYLSLVDPELVRQPRRWVKPAVAFALGLFVLAYLPLRGTPDLATLPGFLEHVLARGFRGDMFALSLTDRLVLLPTLLRFQFNWVLLLGMSLGALMLLRYDRKLALLLVGGFLVHTTVTLTYDAPQTVEYEMPAYVSLALLVAIPVGRFPSGRVRESASLRTCKSTVSSLVHRASFIFLLAGLFNLIVHLPSYRTLSRSHDTRAYAEGLLCEAPEGAVVLSNWHWFTPMRYLQRVEGLRSDLTVEYVEPRGEPLAQTWVDMIERHIAQSPVVVARYFERAYRDLPYRFEPLGEAFLVRKELRFSVPPGLTSLDVTLGERLVLLGYRLEKDTIKPARPSTLTLAWSPTVTLTTDIALFAQLIGPQGRLWSAAEDPRHRAGQLAAGEVVIERFVVYPLLHAPPADYTLVVGAYSSDARLTTADGADTVQLSTLHLKPSTTRPVTRHPLFVRFAGGPTLIGVDYDERTSGQVQARAYLHWAGPGVASTFELLDKHGSEVLGRGRVPALERGEYATVALDLSPLSTMEGIRHDAASYRVPVRLVVFDEDRPRRWNLFFLGSVPLPPPDSAERYVPFGDGMVLTGADGPTRDLARGTEVTLDLRFRSQRPLERDYIASTALTGLRPDGTWAWRDAQDSVPALGAIPTLKWIHGSAVLDPHRLSVPRKAPSVPVSGSLTVYDHFTQASLPNLDERLDPTVLVDTWRMAPP